MGERGAPGRSLDARTRPASGAAIASGAAADDLAAVLARALAALADAAGASRVAAWGRGPDGALRVLAARVQGPKLCAPSEATWAVLARLAGPTDLVASDVPALRALAAEQGFLAAAPLSLSEGEPLALLLVGVEEKPGARASTCATSARASSRAAGRRRAEPGAVRPRLLAALGKAVAQSLRPAAVAAAVQRLALLDAEVQRLDRLAAVGGLLAEIVHEIRNPLVSIKTFLHLLGEAVADSGEFREVAIEELRRIERLLEVVGQHARPPSTPNAEAIAEVEPAIRSVAQLVTLRAVDRGIAVLVELPESIAPARIAGDALRQVLLNLALNAIEATPERGSVRIRAAERDGGIEIALEDEGPGVPEALRARLFEPFFSTKSRPGGLGLAITRRLLEDAGGAIEVESRTPAGSRFRVTLPIARG